MRIRRRRIPDARDTERIEDHEGQQCSDRYRNGFRCPPHGHPDADCRRAPGHVRHHFLPLPHDEHEQEYGRTQYPADDLVGLQSLLVCQA